jgi:hypothetical protein
MTREELLRKLDEEGATDSVTTSEKGVAGFASVSETSRRSEGGMAIMRVR